MCMCLVRGGIRGVGENYTKGRKANTTYRNHKSIQHQLKTGVRQYSVLSLALFIIYTADLPPPEYRIRSCLTQMISPSHQHTQSQVQP